MENSKKQNNQRITDKEFQKEKRRHCQRNAEKELECSEWP